MHFGIFAFCSTCSESAQCFAIEKTTGASSVADCVDEM